jgi:hypothetical protein
MHLSRCERVKTFRVSNAGITGSHKPVEELTGSDAELAFETNAVGMIRTVSIWPKPGRRHRERQPVNPARPGGTEMTETGAEDRVTVCHPAEDQMLLDFLAAQRATALDIVAGLSEEDWHQSVVPSGWTPAGLIEHLSGAQFHWFIGVVAGEDTSPPADADVEPYDPMAAFVADWSYADIIAEFREISARADAILAVTPLSAALRGKHGDLEVAEPPNVRWVVLHLIEEISRHCGHLDIGRELLDGTTRLGQNRSERPAT